MMDMRCSLTALVFAALCAPAMAQTPSTGTTPEAEGTGPAEQRSDAEASAPQAEEGAATEDAIVAPEPRPRTWNKRQVASLRGLDKITGRYTDFRMRVGQPYEFGSLRVHLQVCYQTPPEEVPESAAFLQIDSLKPMADLIDEDTEAEPRIFSGWMFASSPGLNALEHPVYDVWVIECAAPEAPERPGDTD